MEKSIKFTIDHQCPQCGAPAKLEETDRLFTCRFCRVTSYLLPDTCFRYMFLHHAPEGSSLIYFPYWRYKGLLFSNLPDDVRHRFFDFSYPASDLPGFPTSLGLRSQSLTLRFVAPNTDGVFIRPTITADQVMEIIEKRLQDPRNAQVLHQEYIGETWSLIYAPFYVQDKLFDGVLNRPISEKLPEDHALRHLQGDAPGWKTRFVPSICPHCGWDLQGQRDSCILNCRNCHSAWRPTVKGFSKIRFAHLPAAEIHVRYLPFWRIRAEISGIDLQSYEDLVRVANLPKAIQPGWDRIRFRFWAPGFKVGPATFLRTARNITLSQPDEPLRDTFPDAETHPVTLPVEEAIETLKINLGSFLKPRNRLVELLPDIRIHPKSFLLVYIPFRVGHHELINDMHGWNINKNQLALSGNL